jgi:hypothetical protein
MDEILLIESRFVTCLKASHVSQNRKLQHIEEMITETAFWNAHH